MADFRQTLKQYEKIGENPEARGYFGVLATLVLLIVLLLLIFPAVRHIVQINKEITDAREVKVKLENKLENLEQAKANLEAVKADLPLLDLALPVGSDMPKHLVRIDEIAKKYDLEIFTVQFTQVPLSKPSIQASELSTKDFEYSITLQESFTNFKKFLKDFENLIRISDVTTIAVEKEEETPLRLTVGASTYFLGSRLVSEEELGTQGQPTEQQEPSEIIPGESKKE